MPSKYDVYQDEEGLWRWRLVAGNGEIVAQSESYTTKADAERGVADAAHVSKEAGDGD